MTKSHPLFCGAGGSRTLVQTRKYYAFYRLIFVLIFVIQYDRSYRIEPLVPKNFIHRAEHPQTISDLAAPPYRRASEH